MPKKTVTPPSKKHPEPAKPAPKPTSGKHPAPTKGCTSHANANSSDAAATSQHRSARLWPATAVARPHLFFPASH